jgi:hypothetical protein
MKVPELLESYGNNSTLYNDSQLGGPMCSIKKSTNILWIAVTKLEKVQFLDSLLEVRTQLSVHYGEVYIQFGNKE